MTQVTRLLADPVTRRRITIGAVAFLLFEWVFLYRFNTLGGSLGGFDNDHFLYMTLAKIVCAQTPHIQRPEVDRKKQNLKKKSQ